MNNRFPNVGYVQEEGVPLTIWRCCDPSAPGFTFVQSKNFVYEVQETCERFQVDRDMEPGDAYRAWRSSVQNKSSLQERMKSAERREVESSYCFHHKDVNLSEDELQNHKRIVSMFLPFGKSITCVCVICCVMKLREHNKIP